jgi:uncharacterized protein
LPRLAMPGLLDVLAFMRVVAITGPRQSGKTTLARQIAGEGALYRSLDEPDLLAFARTDPVGFLAAGDAMLVIDEIQRAPELMLPLKAAVDADPRPGRYLVTGSADLTALSSLQDALTGRLLKRELLPLAQAELHPGEAGRAGGFLDAVFAGEMPAAPNVDGADLEARVAAGGYPEAIRLSPGRRRQWFEAYATLSAGRDVRDVAAIERADLLPRLLSELALRTSETVNITDLSKVMQISRDTVERYIAVFEQLYLVRRIRPWSRNELSRLAKTPKLHLLDSGLAAALRRYSPGNLAQRTAFGPLLETFVFAELSRLASVHPDPPLIHHYRTLRGGEIDFILETWDRRIVALEVKASATISYDWFATMRTLRDALGPDFVQGIVLYSGRETRRFDDRMIAAPVSALWG